MKQSHREYEVGSVLQGEIWKHLWVILQNCAALMEDKRIGVVVALQLVIGSDYLT